MSESLENLDWDLSDLFVRFVWATNATFKKTNGFKDRIAILKSFWVSLDKTKTEIHGCQKHGLNIPLILQTTMEVSDSYKVTDLFNERKIDVNKCTELLEITDSEIIAKH